MHHLAYLQFRLPWQTVNTVPICLIRMLFIEQTGLFNTIFHFVWIYVVCLIFYCSYAYWWGNLLIWGKSESYPWGCWVGSGFLGQGFNCVLLDLSLTTFLGVRVVVVGFDDSYILNWLIDPFRWNESSLARFHLLRYWSFHSLIWIIFDKHIFNGLSWFIGRLIKRLHKRCPINSIKMNIILNSFLRRWSTLTNIFHIEISHNVSNSNRILVMFTILFFMLNTLLIIQLFIWNTFMTF